MSQIEFFNSGGSSGGITTINGDVGSITGSTVTIFTNHTTNNSGSTILFNNSGTTSTLNVTSAGLNTHFGNIAGSLSESGTSNSSFGYRSMANVTSGSFNTALGEGAMNGASDCQFTTAVGEGALFFANSSYSVAVGWHSMVVGGGEQNTAVGASTLSSLNNGTGNIALGYGAGSQYTSSESGNIVIGNNGTTGQSNSTIIGLDQTFCSIAGISSATVSTPIQVVIDPTTQQLGVSHAGSVIFESVDSSSAVSLTSATPTNIVTLTVTNAGTYAVSAYFSIIAGSGLIATDSPLISISETSATDGVNGVNAVALDVTTAPGDNPGSMSTYIVTLSASESIYLVADYTFSGGTVSVYGSLTAIQLS